MGRFRFSNARRNAERLCGRRRRKSPHREVGPCAAFCPRSESFGSFGRFGTAGLPHRSLRSVWGAQRRTGRPRGGSVRFRTATPAGPGKRRSGEGEPQRGFVGINCGQRRVRKELPGQFRGCRRRRRYGRALRRLQPGAAPGAAGRGQGAAVRSGLGTGGGSWGIWGTSASCGGDKRNGRRSSMCSLGLFATLLAAACSTPSSPRRQPEGRGSP